MDLNGISICCVADGKKRNDIMTLPRSMSINCPRMGNPSPIILKSYPLYFYFYVSSWSGRNGKTEFVEVHSYHRGIKSSLRL